MPTYLVLLLLAYLLPGTIAALCLIYEAVYNNIVYDSSYSDELVDFRNWKFYPFVLVNIVAFPIGYVGLRILCFLS